MYRYKVTPKFQSAISLQWFIWAKDEKAAREKLCQILNEKNTHNFPRWTADEFTATFTSRSVEYV